MFRKLLDSGHAVQMPVPDTGSLRAVQGPSATERAQDAAHTAKVKTQETMQQTKEGLQHTGQKAKVGSWRLLC